MEAMVKMMSGVVLAAGNGHGLPAAAPALFSIGGWEISNSALVAFAVVAGISIFVRVVMANPSLRPSPLQNFVEWVVESLQGLLLGILGDKLAKQTFWFFASVFIFIAVANLIALLPGTGSVGWGSGPSFFETKVITPLLRGANADLNMTLAMSVMFFGLWLYWALKANGVGGFLHHIFGAKAKLPGFLGKAMVVLFFLIGFIELISILLRTPALSLRLYGNIYGGEVLLENMLTMTKNPFLSALVAVPFYFLEVLVAMVQALVFCLLTAVFTAMICKHDDAAHGGHGASKAH